MPTAPAPTPKQTTQGLAEEPPRREQAAQPRRIQRIYDVRDNQTDAAAAAGTEDDQTVTEADRPAATAASAADN